MRKIRHPPLNNSLQSYNSLKMNNLHKIIAIKDIYFIYIDKKVSKKLINKIVVTSSSYGSKYFLIKLLYYNYLSKSNKVVSKISKLSSLYYTIYTILYYLFIYISYYLTITNYIYYNINTLSVGSNLLFFVLLLTTLLFFCSKTVQHSYFFTGFAPVVHRLCTGCTGCEKKSKKI